MAVFELVPDLAVLSNLASSGGVEYWIGQGINIILSTIVGGIVLLIVLAIFSKNYGGDVQAGRVFFIVLIINIITFFGVFGILLSVLAVIPFAGLIAPIIIWIVALTLGFPDMHFIHHVIIAIIFVILTVTIVPFLVGMIPIGI
ncbi:MAG: hypothetical protein ABIH52_04845 [Candidatus Aenigmatarchaeota archaeon]|nr:hypothetical protein [Nanoarchaeota archaeon]